MNPSFSSPTNTVVSTRVEQVVSHLRSMAETLEIGARLPSARELCAQLHISAKTLNDAFNQLEEEKIIRRIHGIGVFVDRHAHQHIAIIADPKLLGHPMTPFWELMLKSLREGARNCGFKNSLHFCDSSNDGQFSLPEDVRRKLDDKSLHGVVGLGLDVSISNWLDLKAVPLVSFAGYSQWLVMLNNATLLSIAADKLLTRGCKRLALWHTLTASIDLVGIAELHMRLRRYGVEKKNTWHCVICTPN